MSAGGEGRPLNRSLQKYLRTRAVTAPWRINGCARTDFSAAVVIPALAESKSLPETLKSLATNPAADLHRTLVLIVVNNRLDADDELRNDNRQTLDWLQANPDPQLNLAWVDAGSPGLELPANEGVGLARKIGFDLALSRLDWSASPFLVSLDADTLVDDKYLPSIFNHFRNSRVGGATLPFKHQPGETPEQEAAIRRYELYLRSYLFGLQQAGSPYAYPTIGSAFACTASNYVAAGGMNRRLAAEDFYFLQQLAKTSGIELVRGTLVKPSSRSSSRASFGTGKAVQDQMEQQRSHFQFVSAQSFQVLKNWLTLVDAQWQAPAQDLLESATELSADLGIFLQDLDFLNVWSKLRMNFSRRGQFLNGFHGWFDGLRTRQLLQRIDRYPGRSTILLEELLAWGGFAGVRSEAEQLALLECLQGSKETG